MSFAFNRDYHDTEQVAAFLPAFLEVYEELRAAGKYPYNDSFKGRIPGIEGPDEDTAIYLLQTLKHLQDQDAKIAEYLADGFEHIESVDEVTRFSGIVNYGFCVGGTGWREWERARLVPTRSPRQRAITGGIGGVMPKGARTRTIVLLGGKFLVKR